MADPTNRGKLYGLVISILPLGLAVYCWWTYAFVYRWLAELQLMVLGFYEANLTFLFTYFALVLLWILPVAGVIRLFRIRVDQTQTNTSALRFQEWFEANQLYICGIILGGTFVFLEMMDRNRRASAGEWTTVLVADLEKGMAPPSNRLLLEHGRLLTEARVVWTENSMTLTYVPLVSLPVQIESGRASPGWQPGEPIAVVVAMRESELNAHQGKQIRGSVNRVLVLGGHVRVSFEKQGIRFTDSAIRVEYGVDHGSPGGAPIFIILGIIIMVGTSVAWAFKIRRGRVAIAANP